MARDKTKVVRVRCSPQTMKRFKVYVAEFGYKDQEDALNGLLDTAYKNKPRTVFG